MRSIFAICFIFFMFSASTVDALSYVSVKSLPINPATVCNGLKGADRFALLPITYAYSDPPNQSVTCTSTSCPNNSGLAYCNSSVYQCICAKK